MSNVGSSISITTFQKFSMFSHFIVVSIATVFLLATISFISYLFCCRSATSPVDLRSQTEQSVEIGLDDTTINSWPKLTYTDAKRRDPRAAAASCCSICLVNYEEEGEGKALRLLPECGHLFHAACVDPWLRQQPTCPVCRSSAVNGAMLTPLAEVVPLAIGPA